MASILKAISSHISPNKPVKYHTPNTLTKHFTITIPELSPYRNPAHYTFGVLKPALLNMNS